MTGGFRLVLAMLVVASHLSGEPYTRHLGYFAVGCFFVLSGFAMTAALNEVYKFRTELFWRNRFWRLAPLYLFACCLTAMVIREWPEHTRHFFARWDVAPSSSEVLENFAVLPLAFGAPHFRFLEQSWSLAVEIFMYAFLCVVIARNIKLAAFALIAGALYHVGRLTNDASFNERYFALMAAFLPFSLGATGYFLHASGRLRLCRRFSVMIALMWATNLFAWGLVLPVEGSLGLGFYLNFALALPFVAALYQAEPTPALRRIDDAMGEFAYPVFLTHWIGGFLAHEYVVPFEERGGAMFLVGLAFTFAIALVFAAFQARLIEPLRRSVRSEVAQRVAA